jgi:hypothetical protein
MNREHRTSGQRQSDRLPSWHLTDLHMHLVLAPGADDDPLRHDRGESLVSF